MRTYIDIHANIFHKCTQLHLKPTGENPIRTITLGSLGKTNSSDSFLTGEEHSTAENSEPSNPTSRPSSVLQTCNTGRQFQTLLPAIIYHDMITILQMRMCYLRGIV